LDSLYQSVWSEAYLWRTFFHCTDHCKKNKIIINGKLMNNLQGIYGLLTFAMSIHTQPMGKFLVTGVGWTRILSLRRIRPTNIGYTWERLTNDTNAITTMKDSNTIRIRGCGVDLVTSNL